MPFWCWAVADVLEGAVVSRSLENVENGWVEASARQSMRGNAVIDQQKGVMAHAARRPRGRVQPAQLAGVAEAAPALLEVGRSFRGESEGPCGATDDGDGAGRAHRNECGGFGRRHLQAKAAVAPPATPPGLTTAPATRACPGVPEILLPLDTVMTPAVAAASVPVQV